MDRFELDLLLGEWVSIEEQIKQVDAKIVARASRSEPGKLLTSTQLLMTAPGVSYYSGLGLASRIGPVERFPRPRSLANYFGLTPSSRNSGEAKDRLGSITKEGSKFARFLLRQLVLHFLKKDPRMRVWYRRIKLRRGSKIAALLLAVLLVIQLFLFGLIEIVLRPPLFRHKPTTRRLAPSDGAIPRWDYRRAIEESN